MKFILPDGQTQLITAQWIASELKLDSIEAQQHYQIFKDILNAHAKWVCPSWSEEQPEIDLKSLNNLINIINIINQPLCEPDDKVHTGTLLAREKADKKNTYYVKKVQQLLYAAFPAYFDNETYPPLQALQTYLR